MNDRLPEMLWASLILASTDRRDAFQEFNRVLQFVASHDRKKDLSNLTLTGLSNLEGDLRREVLTFITANPRTAQALASLTLFDALPNKEEWEARVPAGRKDWPLVLRAVGNTLWHQSDHSTDCRWVRVMGEAAAGRISLANGMEDLAKRLTDYPNLEPGCPEGASVRATEINFGSVIDKDRTWSRAFWTEAWEKSPCIGLLNSYSAEKVKGSTTRQKLKEVVDELTEHWGITHSTTAIDAKHDAIFGMAFYSLRIVREMMSIGLSTSVLARLGLRTILEVRINLQYLVNQKDADLWRKWRRYGTGQAKLSSLKVDAFQEPPEFIDPDSLEKIASEDLWEEFVTVDLGSWAGSDLRKISQQVSLKETYDRYYPWSSTYSHGMWGSIREACYQTCGNPLHRLHRIPNEQALGDCLYDAVILTDEILQIVDVEYPSFAHRLFEPT